MAGPSARALTTTTALAAVLLLAGGCGEPATAPTAGEPTSATTTTTPSGSSSSASSSSTSPGTTGGTGTEAPEEPTGAEPPFGADPAVPVEALDRASGGPLSVTAVRVAAHEGFERVVFELGGTTAGEPGWLVRYVEEATADGSGEVVEVAGGATLQVILTPTGYPQDTGAAEHTGRTAAEGTTAVAEVVTGAVFEGQTLAHVGLAERAPFRVFSLTDPTRVVVDVQIP